MAFLYLWMSIEPTCELGWYTHLQHKGWQIFANFRAAFGHVLINRTRLLHEPKPLNPIYNLVETDLVEPNLRINRYSSLYVENADFIKLDNLSIRKQLQLSNLNNAELQISLTAQNLFLEQVPEICTPLIVTIQLSRE